jgi:hypothetical protein
MPAELTYSNETIFSNFRTRSGPIEIYVSFKKQFPR